MHNESTAPAALARALRAAGLDLGVEGRGTLAVLTPTAATHLLLTPDERRRLLALARDHGFTHAALEVPAPAALPGTPHAGAR